MRQIFAVDHLVQSGNRRIGLFDMDDRRILAQSLANRERFDQPVNPDDAAAQAQGEKLAGKTVTISQKAGVDGRLFGSVTNADIAEALKSQGVEIVKAQVRLPNGPLKVVGEQTVAIALHHDVVVDVTVAVVGETD